MKLSWMERLQMNVWPNDIKKVFDHGGNQANDSQIVYFVFWMMCFQGINTLTYMSFARMTATKMAVDLRRLQLYAGRSSASTVARAPGTWTPTASSLLVQQLPLLVICMAQCEAPAGNFWNVLTHRKQLKSIINFLLKRFFWLFFMYQLDVKKIKINVKKFHNAAAALYALSPSTGMIKLSLGCVFL